MNYELIYILLDRSHGDSYVEYYIPFKVSKLKDTIEIRRYAGPIFELESVKSSFNKRDFELVSKYHLSSSENDNSCRFDDEIITNLSLRKYNVGDTINKCYLVGWSNEKIIRYSVVIGKDTLSEYKSLTFILFEGDVTGENTYSLNSARRYTYLIDSKLRSELISYDDYYMVEFNTPTDTSRLVAFRKKGSKKWKMVYTPDSTFSEKLEVRAIKK